MNDSNLQDTESFFNTIIRSLHQQADRIEVEADEACKQKKIEAGKIREAADTLKKQFPKLNIPVEKPMHKLAVLPMKRPRGFYTEEAYRYLKANGPTRVSELLTHLRTVFGEDVNEEMIKSFVKRMNNDPTSPLKRHAEREGVYIYAIKPVGSDAVLSSHRGQ